MDPSSTTIALAIKWFRNASLGSQVVVGLGALGIALVGLSLVPGPEPDGAWLRDFLMTIGSSLALFAPFYLLTRSLDHHLDRVAVETARQVETVRTETDTKVEEVRAEAAEARATLTEDVEALRADVDRRMDDVTERVSARLAAEATANRDAVASLRTNPTREAVWEAMTRAQRLGLVTNTHPPRVRISPTTNLYASIEADDSDNWVDEPLQVRIETLNGQVQDWIPWPEDLDAVEVLVAVGTHLAKHTGETFDPQSFLNGMADLLAR